MTLWFDQFADSIVADRPLAFLYGLTLVQAILGVFGCCCIAYDKFAQIRELKALKKAQERAQECAK